MADTVKLNETENNIIADEAIKETSEAEVSSEAEASSEELMAENSEEKSNEEATNERSGKENSKVVPDEQVEDATEGLPDEIVQKIQPKPIRTTNAAVRKANAERARRRVETRMQREKNDEIRESNIANESVLESAIARGAFVTGKVSSVEYLEADGMKEVAANVFLDTRTKIVIPFDELFPENPIQIDTVDLSTAEGRRAYLDRKLRFAKKLIGSDIIFILKERFYDAENNIAFFSATRAEAMRKLRKQSFTGDMARYHEGDIVDAPIIAVSLHAITVEFGGVATTIKQHDLTLHYYKNLNYSEFHVGGTVKVRIDKIMELDNGAIQLRLNHIACELEDAKSRCHLINKYTYTHGIITNVHRIGHEQQGIRMFAWLDKLELPARIVGFTRNSFGRAVVSGTDVEVVVLGHDPNGFLRCRISQIFESEDKSRF